MSQRIGLNLQSLAASSLTGIGTYTLEIARRLPRYLGDTFECEGHVFDFAGRNHAAERIFDFFTTDAAAMAEIRMTDGTATSSAAADLSAKPAIRAPLTGAPLFPVLTCRLFPLGAYIRAGFWGRIITYQNLVGSKAETTVFFNYLRPDRVQGRTIITVYDMVSERYPETMDKRNRNLLRRFLKNSCDKADMIVTISEFSKNEIVACLGIAPDKIRVAMCGFDEAVYYPPVDSSERTSMKEYLQQKYKISSPYILNLGTLEPRKNIDALLQAFSLLHDRFPSLKLVICGGLGWQYEKTLAKIESLGLGDSIIRTGYIPEADKRMLYASAEVFVFPSWYEGFGLPVLESMACGTPVVSSRASSLPEVVGDAGILCDPSDPGAFADAVGRLLSDRDLYHDLQTRQKERVRLFTWENAAKAYAEAILEVTQK